MTEIERLIETLRHKNIRYRYEYWKLHISETWLALRNVKPRPGHDKTSHPPAKT